MGNLFQDIFDAMKRSEKEMMIGKSGSTPEGKYEKIRSGQSYLYKKYGMESEVIEVRFKKKVTGSFLNEALRTTIERYPYFNTKLIEKDGDFYIVQNEQSLIARRTKELARLGGNVQHIESIHLYNSGTTGLGINMIDCGEEFVLDFKQNFSSDKYVRAFCTELEKLGIGCTVSDRISFITPGDSIIKREKQEKETIK